MPTDETALDPALLRRFIPLNELTHDNLIELLHKSSVGELAAGETLFERGSQTHHTYYLIAGEVSLQDDAGAAYTLKADSEAARQPIDASAPRRCTATAVTPMRYIAIDNQLLDIQLTWEQHDGYLVSSIDEQHQRYAGEAEDADWMVQLLQKRQFQRIPPVNIQAMFMRLQPRSCQAGERIVQQGDVGDFYYHIRRGHAEVLYEGKQGRLMRLATLNPGEGFGEEALLTDERRNASVVMLSDGLLMQLEKRDFIQLLKTPLLNELPLDQAQQLIDSGRARWLDVRLESEHCAHAIPNSLHLPFYALRQRINELPTDQGYVVYCNTGSRSNSAAYLMIERGLQVWLLRGGLMAYAAQLMPNNR